MKRRFYPAALNVKGRSCLVIGADGEAVDKARRLAEAGAEVALVWPQATPEAKALSKLGVSVSEAPFSSDLIADQFLVVLTVRTDRELTASVVGRCRERRVLLAALDQPDHCDVIHMSLYDRGPLRVGISTEGVSPGLAKKIREGLERSLSGEPLEEFLDHLARLRAQVEREILDPAERRRTLLAALEGFEFKAAVTLPPDWKEKKR